MSALMHPVTIATHVGECISVYNLKVTLRTDATKSVVECGSEHWRCDSVAFDNRKCVDSLNLVVRDETDNKAKEMRMLMKLDQLCY